MSAELITAAAAVAGAAIGVVGTVIGAHVTGQSQLRVAQAQQVDAQRESQRAAYAAFLASLDVYVVTSAEVVWANDTALRSDADPDHATKDLNTQYREVWFNLLAANARLQLVVDHDRREVADAAGKVVETAREIDRVKWNYVDHRAGKRIPKEYQPALDELAVQRERLVSAARRLLSPPTTHGQSAGSAPNR